MPVRNHIILSRKNVFLLVFLCRVQSGVKKDPGQSGARAEILCNRSEGGQRRGLLICSLCLGVPLKTWVPRYACSLEQSRVVVAHDFHALHQRMRSVCIAERPAPVAT